MFKNRNVQIVIGVIVILVVLGGGYFYINSKSKTSAPKDQSASQDVIMKLSPEELGLSIVPKDDKKAVKIVISKASGIKTIEYELTYEADSTAQEKSEGGDARVQRGITGDATVDSGKSSYESSWLDLGSCSRNVCRYDTGVDSVDLTLKIVKTDGKTYQAEKSQQL